MPGREAQVRNDERGERDGLARMGQRGGGGKVKVVYTVGGKDERRENGRSPTREVF